METYLRASHLMKLIFLGDTMILFVWKPYKPHWFLYYFGQLNLFFLENYFIVFLYNSSLKNIKQLKCKVESFKYKKILPPSLVPENQLLLKS